MKRARRTVRPVPAVRSGRTVRAVRINACAKINLTLRVLGVRADGYHELRTVFQSLALHDALTIAPARGPFEIECDEPGCPIDRTNLVWRAAARLWRLVGRRGAPRGVRVQLAKRIPMEAGLGGGSSDAAAALRGLAALWRARVSDADLSAIAAELGADVPYFLLGGTALGVGRGDVLFGLPDSTPAWVVLVLPGFGVSTSEAYAWFDAPARAGAPIGNRQASGPSGQLSTELALPASELRNDLEPAVARHHPEIAETVAALRRTGAHHAAMSGSGSAVFGLFGNAAEAESAAADLQRRGRRAILTRTLTRREFDRVSCPR